MKFLFLTSDLIEGRDIKSKYINTITEFIPQPNYIKVAEEPGVDCGIRKNMSIFSTCVNPGIPMGSHKKIQPSRLTSCTVANIYMAKRFFIYNS